MSVLIGLGFILLIIPGLILLTMWFVATPACVVEQLGPIRQHAAKRRADQGASLEDFRADAGADHHQRRGHPADRFDLGATWGAARLPLIGGLIWNGVWGAFYAIAVVVTYHDLRVAKEGINIEQIAAVFD